nr:MFS transporter [Dolosicoccus paucivorans]
MTSIGQRFGWRIEYYVVGGLILTIALLSALFLPSISGEKVAKDSSPLTLLKQPSILLVLALTLLAVIAHYAAYTYITAIVDALAFSGGIQMALILFGIGSIISVWIAGRYVDEHLYLLSLFLLSTGVISMGLFLSSAFIHIVSYLGFLLWGVSFGALVTLFQAAITRQVSSGTDIATSLQSSTFNLAIMIGSWVGSILLSSPNRSALSIVTLAFILLIISVVVSYVSKPTLDK